MFGGWIISACYGCNSSKSLYISIHNSKTFSISHFRHDQTLHSFLILPWHQVFWTYNKIMENTHLQITSVCCQILHSCNTYSWKVSQTKSSRLLHPLSNSRTNLALPHCKKTILLNTSSHQLKEINNSIPIPHYVVRFMIIASSFKCQCCLHGRVCFAKWLGACWSPVRFDITGAAGRLLEGRRQGWWSSTWICLYLEAPWYQDSQLLMVKTCQKQDTSTK